MGCAYTDLERQGLEETASLHPGNPADAGQTSPPRLIEWSIRPRLPRWVQPQPLPRGVHSSESRSWRAPPAISAASLLRHEKTIVLSAWPEGYSGDKRMRSVTAAFAIVSWEARLLLGTGI